MLRRDTLVGLLGSAALTLPLPALAYEVTKTDAEWKKILTPAAYNTNLHS